MLLQPPVTAGVVLLCQDVLTPFALLETTAPAGDKTLTWHPHTMLFPFQG